MHVLPYLFFEGRCEEALEFYQKALGAKVERVMRYKDNPEPAEQKKLPPGSENKVMHASFHIGKSMLMASDGHCSGKVKFEGVSLTIVAENEGEAKKWFGGLSDGGQVRMPLTKTFFSPLFGMVVDRFGLLWMILVGQ